MNVEHVVRTTRNDDKRKSTTPGGDWKDTDPEGLIRREEEHKRRKYNEKGQNGDSVRGRSTNEVQRSSRRDDGNRRYDQRYPPPTRGRDTRQSTRHGGHNSSTSSKPTAVRSTQRVDTTPRTHESVDAAQDMLTAFPSSSTSSSRKRCADPLAPVMGTWADEMEKIDKREDNKENGAPNPWKKSESTGERLTDEKRLTKRQRQIDIGKETVGYKVYCEKITRAERTKHHPQTPDKGVACSSRSWQGVVRVWRRKLHYWDTPEVVEKYRKKMGWSDDEEEEEEEDEDKIVIKTEEDDGFGVKSESIDKAVKSEQDIDMKEEVKHEDEEYVTEAMLFVKTEE